MFHPIVIGYKAMYAIVFGISTCVMIKKMKKRRRG